MQFPRFFAGEITLGAMTQSASAFGNIQDGLSFFRNAYDSVRRLPGRDHPPGRPGDRQRRGQGAAGDHDHGVCRRHCQLDDIEVRTPDGKQLVKPLDLRLEVGDTMVVTGPSGSGKTTLLRSLAELWPFTTAR